MAKVRASWREGVNGLRFSPGVLDALPCPIYRTAETLLCAWDSYHGWRTVKETWEAGPLFLSVTSRRTSYAPDRLLRPRRASRSPTKSSRGLRQECRCWASSSADATLFSGMRRAEPISWQYRRGPNR